MPTVTSHHHSQRELLGELLQRLTRVRAASHSIQSLANAKDTTATTLADALASLERDLLLAAGEAERVRGRIKR